ncbi:MAG TPA: penicillin-binding transpeptidase domain-containing protein [Edaphocola sp.]|nr:penicillin-binding transpeptidase domain-containing protein [Edaphocola sp.]
MTTLKSFVGFAVLFVMIVVAMPACRDVRVKEHQEWKAYFQENDIQDACFEMYDNNKEIALYFNKKRCSERMTPGAVFDIFNALVALSSNVALDEQFKLRTWSNMKGAMDSLTLKQAFQEENGSYFEQLAILTDSQKMQFSLDTVQFGNMLMGGAPGQFYKDGRLKVTADEMVGFMKRLYHGELPAFDQRSIRLVQGMLLQETKPDEKLYYRYASLPQSDSTLHWLVGYMEHTEGLKNPKTGKTEYIPHPYFFAMNFTTPASAKDWKSVSLQILKDILKVSHAND